jgi:hypothetical protein
MTKTIFGLPITGLMGTNPAISVGAVIAAVSFVVNFLIGQGIIGVPTPELQAFFDEHGTTLAAAAVSALALVQGWVTRNRVVSPATAAAIAPEFVVTTKQDGGIV